MATACRLSPMQVSNLSDDPLLRSSRVLDCLFHAAAVICESDSDRAVYEKVNRRLQSQGSGVADAVFINAQNWQTESRIHALLADLNVPSVAIVDFDTILSGRDIEWQRMYAAAGIADENAERLHNKRRGFMKKVSVSEAVKKDGIRAVPVVHQREVIEQLVSLAEHGIFVVPSGELESWFRTAKVELPTRKRDWAPTVLTSLGDDTLAVDAADDIGAFMYWVGKKLTEGRITNDAYHLFLSQIASST